MVTVQEPKKRGKYFLTVWLLDHLHVLLVTIPSLAKHPFEDVTTFGQDQSVGRESEYSVAILGPKHYFATL